MPDPRVRGSVINNALSVDVEEYYHGMEFEAALGFEGRTALPSRVEASVERVLALLARADVRATFFVLGCVAERHPAMVRRIADAGHEIACHGWAHQLVWRQTAGEFRADVRGTKHLLEDLTSQAVLGYRAPNYSIGPRTPWAFQILLEEGFRYDSSVYPIRHDRYGMPRAPRFPHVVAELDGLDLWEVPIGTLRVLGHNLPIGGGGPFRLFPLRYFTHGIEYVNHREGRGVVFYFHPWELDPDQPRPRMPWSHRFRHYVNLERMERKLGRLLGVVRFIPLAELLDGDEKSLACTGRALAGNSGR